MLTMAVEHNTSTESRQGVASRRGISVALNILLLAALLSLLWQRSLNSASSSIKTVCSKKEIAKLATENPDGTYNSTASVAVLSLSKAEANKIRSMFACLDPDGPQPVILMSMGRSGSSSIWQMISNLTGYETRSWELPGSNDKEETEFFHRHDEDDAWAGEWLKDSICNLQKTYPQAAVVGFKWKPYRPTFEFQSAQAALQLIGDLWDLFPQHPPIKVVRSRRNLLDVYISRQKHKVSLNTTLGAAVPAHCKVSDKECLDLALKASTGMNLDTFGLLQFLKDQTQQEDRVDQMLLSMGIPHIQVKYEKLYYNYYAAEEWQRISAFLEKGPATNLTLRNIENAMKIAPTHAAPTQKVTLSSFDEVAGLLEGTEFEHLLHR
jgi:hypothetical protein